MIEAILTVEGEELCEEIRAFVREAERTEKKVCK
jgi:hypothetical protein